MRPTRTISIAIAVAAANSAIAQVTIAEAGPDQYLCSSNAFLQANAPDSGEYGYWTALTGVLYFNDPTDPQTGVFYAAPGQNVLQWTITNGTDASADFVSIWVYDGNAPDANAGLDIVIQAPQTSVVLQAGPYSWPTSCWWAVVMGSGTISEPNEAITTYSGASIGSNILHWTCDNGPCGITTDEVVVTVEEALALGWIPDLTRLRTAFDPITGLLMITGTASIGRVLITDQTGRVVRDRSMNARSGSLDVSDLSSGSYFVRVLIDDEAFTDRFTVVR